MINNIAYIIGKIGLITGCSPVKKALQKVIYLLEEKGVDLSCHYILHFYGPYCAELNNETLRLSAEGILCFDYTGYGHKMHVNPEYEQSIETDLPTIKQAMVEEVIQRYKAKSPSDLELLTTAIYAYHHTDAKTRPELIRNVRMIKGEKYNEAEINWALGEFSYFGILV